MLANLKISVRLGLAFGISSLLLLAVVLLGISRLADVNENIDELANDKYPKVVFSYNLIGEIQQTAVSMRNATLAADPAVVRRELATI